jgi:transposase
MSDNAGKKIKEFRIVITAYDFNFLLDQLNQLTCDKSEIMIGIETDKNILADFLVANGYAVYSINPLKVSRFKERYTVSAKKDDKFDAESIARFLHKDGSMFRPVMRSSAECEELRVHCETVRLLIRERTMLINRLRADLSLYFPSFLGFFRELDTSVPLNILRAIQGPAHIKGLSEEQFLEKISEVKYIGAVRKKCLYGHLNAETIHFDSDREKGLSRRVIILAEQILKLNESISELEKDVAALYERHEMQPVFSSLPGAGKRLAPRLLTSFGDNRDRFESYQSVQCYAGTAPVTEKSGKSFFSVKMRRACNKTFKDDIYQFANCSLKQEPWAMQFYQEQKSNGKSHSRAVRALGNKWLKIIYRMWKDGVQYDRNVFLEKREKFASAFG